jgi:hypothetical protein
MPPPELDTAKLIREKAQRWKHKLLTSRKKVPSALKKLIKITISRCDCNGYSNALSGIFIWLFSSPSAVENNHDGARALTHVKICWFRETIGEIVATSSFYAFLGVCLFKLLQVSMHTAWNIFTNTHTPYRCCSLHREIFVFAVSINNILSLPTSMCMECYHIIDDVASARVRIKLLCIHKGMRFTIRENLNYF